MSIPPQFAAQLDSLFGKWLRFIKSPQILQEGSITRQAVNRIGVALSQDLALQGQDFEIELFGFREAAKGLQHKGMIGHAQKRIGMPFSPYLALQAQGLCII